MAAYLSIYKCVDSFPLFPLSGSGLILLLSFFFSYFDQICDCFSPIALMLLKYFFIGRLFLDCWWTIFLNHINGINLVGV